MLPETSRGAGYRFKPFNAAFHLEQVILWYKSMFQVWRVEFPTLRGREKLFQGLGGQSRQGRQACSRLRLVRRSIESCETIPPPLFLLGKSAINQLGQILTKAT